MAVRTCGIERQRYNGAIPHRIVTSYGCFVSRGMQYAVGATVVPLGMVPYRAVHTVGFAVQTPLANVIPAGSYRGHRYRLYN